MKSQRHTPSSPIGVGDLVRIVQSHDCDPNLGLGYITTVERIEIARAFQCAKCMKIDHSLDGQKLAYGTIAGTSGYWPLAWLRRIPPLAELEDQDTREDLREPA